MSMVGLTMKYFVLNPNKKDMYGVASRTALIKYANVIMSTNQKLAKDIYDWVA